MGALKRDNPGRGEGGISSRCGECVWGCWRGEVGREERMRYWFEREVPESSRILLDS